MIPKHYRYDIRHQQKLQKQRISQLNKEFFKIKENKMNLSLIFLKKQNLIYRIRRNIINFIQN